MEIGYIKREEIENILSDYRIGLLVGYKRIKKGLINKIFSLKTTKEELILKIATEHSPYRVIYEIELLNHLKNLPTPKPIKNKKGNYLFDYHGNKGFLYQRLPGRHRKIITSSTLKEAGNFLGKFHLQTENFKSNIERLETISTSEESIKKIIKRSQKVKDPKSQNALSYISKNIFKYKLPEKLSQGAIHVDIKPENMLFANNKLTGVVDFDNSYNGPLILDLAITLKWFATERSQFDAKKALIIYEVYKKVRSLKKIEKEFLFEALHFAYLRNVLRAIEFLFLKKIPRSFVHWAIDEFLGAEKNMNFTKDKFIRIFT